MTGNLNQDCRYSKLFPASASIGLHQPQVRLKSVRAKPLSMFLSGNTPLLTVCLTEHALLSLGLQLSGGKSLYSSGHCCQVGQLCIYSASGVKQGTMIILFF